MPTQQSTPIKTPQYTIQVGAYKTESNANQMVSNLLKKGYKVQIKPSTENGVQIFKVHVDEFSNKKQARKVAEKFATKENLPSFVTTSSSN